MRTFIKLHQNWNHKLGCKGFTLIVPDEHVGLYNIGKIYQLFVRKGKGEYVFEGDRHKYELCGSVEIIAIQAVTLDKITDAMAVADIGYPAQYLKSVFSKCYHQHFAQHGHSMPMLRMVVRYLPNQTEVNLTPDQVAEMFVEETNA